MPKHDLRTHPPRMNAAGSLGSSPDTHSPVDWSKLGAFVTNPISLSQRTPARGRRFIEFPGGVPPAHWLPEPRNYPGYTSKCQTLASLPNPNNRSPPGRKPGGGGNDDTPVGTGGGSVCPGGGGGSRRKRRNGAYPYSGHLWE